METMINSNGESIDIKGQGHIEHRVTKFDTLAGVAIKYGVEVADIKRINGLATDLQMFARKSLYIPLPGKHPPSPSLVSGQNGAEQIPSQHSQHDLLDSFQSLRLTSSSQQNTSHRDLLDTFQSLRLTSTSQQKASHAMRSLQGYYGLKPENKAASDGLEMSIYRQGESRQSEDNPSRTSPALKHPLGLRQKSRSLANGLASHNSEPSDSIRVPLLGEYEPDKWNDEPTTPEMLLKDENNPVSGFSATRGKKGIALRPKAANRTASPAGNEGGFVVNPIPSGLSDSLSADRLSGVRKSSSTPSLNDDGHSSATSIWNLKPDLQALSSVAIPKPIFDSRRRKAALD